MTKELRAALDEQRPYAAYSKNRTHGIHVNKDHDCREYVVGECFIDAALASAESGDEGLARKREHDAVVAAIEPLILAFRRWCVRRNIEPPTTAEFRAILEESAEIRADLDHADEVGVDHASRPMLREVLH